MSSCCCGTSRAGVLTWQQDKRKVGAVVQRRECTRKVWLEDKAGVCWNEQPKQFTVKSILEEAGKLGSP